MKGQVEFAATRKQHLSRNTYEIRYVCKFAWCWDPLESRITVLVSFWSKRSQIRTLTIKYLQETLGREPLWNAIEINLERICPVGDKLANKPVNYLSKLSFRWRLMQPENTRLMKEIWYRSYTWKLQLFTNTKKKETNRLILRSTKRVKYSCDAR